MNLQITFMAFFIGLLVAIFIALIEKEGPSWLKSLTLVYATCFRGTPVLIQIFFAYYGFPLLGISWPPLAVVTLVIGLNSGAYISQILISGLQSISNDQFLAARALSMNTYQTYRYVIFPQCFRNVLPALSNEIINLLKDSSLASIVGITELVKVGNLIRGRSYETFSVFLGVALIFLLMTSGITYFMKKAQRWSDKPCSV